MEYTRKTIALLLERDIGYLSEITGCDIPDNSTVDAVIAIIYNKTQEAKKEQFDYTCKKCNSRDVIARNEQLRSADEGSTTVYKCNSCGYRWH